jgi:hypothetical protein
MKCFYYALKGGERMNFSKALELLKQGKKIKRTGWNGKNQYLELATCISYKNLDGKVINPNHNTMGNNAIAFVGTSGVQLGWLASQADMLAEDWLVVEKYLDRKENLSDYSVEELFKELSSRDNVETLEIENCFIDGKKSTVTQLQAIF